MARSSEDIRNVALFGQGNTGKTALVDAIAHIFKITNRMGDSADGTSISNTDPEEKERHQTLASHVFSFDVEGMRLNLVDTPGHPDFFADAISSFQAVETGILCVSAATGVTFHARRLWAEAGKAGIGRAIMVSHVDGENTSFEDILEQLVEAFGDVVVPLTYPNANGSEFSEIHDVIAGDGPSAGAYMERLEERVAEADDELLEAYLEEGSLAKEKIIEHMPRAIVQGKLVPVFAVSPKREIGLRKLCSNLRKDFASPVSFGPRNASEPGSGSYGELIEPDPQASFAGVVFKVLVDPYVGRLSFLRCLRGTLKPEEALCCVRTGSEFKAAGLLEVRGKDTENVNEVIPGDLFAVSKVESLELGDTVTAPGAAIELQPPEYPEPIYALAVNPKSRGDEQKINQGLEKLATEDPTFRVRRDETTGELVVSGNSPIHLEVQFARLHRRYGVGVDHHPPTIPYRETVTGKADGHHRHKKQSGGRGQFAEVYLRIASREAGSGFEFVDSVVGGSIPRQFIPEVEKGIRKFLAKGALAGFPVVDVQAEVYDGKYHDVDSDQLSFQLAGERAFLDAFEKAKPVLLEPIMDVDIHVPERFTGDVAGNLSSHRGRMSGMEVVDGIQHIKAQVPLKELQEYSTQLRSITAGEGSFSMKPSHYEMVPPQVQQAIVAEARRKHEEAHK